MKQCLVGALRAVGIALVLIAWAIGGFVACLAVLFGPLLLMGLLGGNQ